MSIQFATQTGKFLCAALLGSEMDMSAAAMDGGVFPCFRWSFCKTKTPMLKIGKDDDF